MSESSAGDSSAVKVIHWIDDKGDWLQCVACCKILSICDHTTDEVLLYNNPPDNFIQCTPPSTQQELDLDP